MKDVLKRIHDYALEDIMGDRFGNYAKEIIQDRAIPDVRDGLKPVQRRILYAMHKAGNTSDKPFIKCAATVGDVLGKFHPHGDSSVYDAMVRMSQWWKQNTILVSIHGNNGSIDGDGPAAYRYTEARLGPISKELLRDLEKETIPWAPNFDDRFLEPTVLPAQFPNLLVNGASGISAGYATNIPPHNLGEIIDATIKRIDSPNCRLDTILEIVKGPDFPTGGIVEGKNGIIDAFTTGRGKVIVKCKYEVLKEKGREQIIIHEIPFEVNKAMLVNKIDSIRIDKKIDGIAEVRDESDREEAVRIVIDLKKDSNRDLIINYLLKNTELQVSYNYNMVSIVNRRPMTLGIIPILDAYIEHKRSVVLKRTQFDLATARREIHIVEGLIKALSILDEVIKCIRSSKNKSDAKDNLVSSFGFSREQAEAIVTLQLYKLTNTDVTELEEKHRNLLILIADLEEIIGNEDRLKCVMKDELRAIKKEYATPRLTEIKDEITEIKIDNEAMLPKEDCIVVVTNDGYVKRVSLRSYDASEQTMVKDGDFVIGLYKINTLNTVLLFTDLGNYLYLPVYEIPECKWKELGKHISNIIKLEPNENIIKSIPVYDFSNSSVITMVSRNGMIKRTNLSDFKVSRYSKAMTAFKLKDDDKVVSVSLSSGDEIFISTYNGIGLRFLLSEVGITGVKSSGVKGISLKNDYVVSSSIFSGDNDYLCVITLKSTGKRVRMSEFERTSRGRKGIQLIRDVKTNPYRILKTFVCDKCEFTFKVGNDFDVLKSTSLPIMDRYSTGSSISKGNISSIFESVTLIDSDDAFGSLNESPIEEVETIDIKLDEIDEQILTIDDFLDDFKIG
jgi:topoisomerase-4 subunit A